MGYLRWIVWSFFGLIVGAGVGAIQLYATDSTRYVASLELKERVLFDEYWNAAPDFLIKAELVRNSLVTTDSDSGVTLDSLTAELLNSWFRFLDNNLFRFVVDGALSTGNIGDEFQRYARTNPGMIDGLNQRSITFTVAGDNPQYAEDRLLEWVDEIKEESTVRSSEALTAWLSRKGRALRLLSEQGGLGFLEEDRGEIGQIASDFEKSAKSFPFISPYFGMEMPVVVEQVGTNRLHRILLWAGLGVVITLLLLIALKSRQSRE
ncbi:MAG: hypothetical protein ABJM11_06375 [Marinobacter sp.]|uniref:hypothetical protein n=1 Tax=Marinobacter sp. TaxID=50741 RepID=UPI0032972CC0